MLRILLLSLLMSYSLGGLAMSDPAMPRLGASLRLSGELVPRIPAKAEHIQDRNSVAAPDRAIRGLTVLGATLPDALAAALDQVGVGWVVERGVGTPKTDEFRASLSGVSGSVAQVMDTIGAAYGVDWTYTDGRVVVSPSKAYELLLPPVKGVGDAVVTAAKSLGAKEAQFDPVLGALLFSSDKQTAERVERHVTRLISEQKQIVYEVQVFQVTLADKNQTGIAWNKFSWSDGTTSVNMGKLAAGTAGITSQLTVQAGKVGLDILLNFLATQGETKIQDKLITRIMSGGTGRVRNGQDTPYLKSLTQLKDTQGNTSPAIEQAVAKSGFELKLAGRVRDKTVYTDVTLAVDALTALAETRIGDSIQITQPVTSKKEIEGTLRLVDGQAAILGGAITERQEKEKSKWLRWATNKAETTTRAELVFYITAHVIDYDGAGSSKAE